MVKLLIVGAEGGLGKAVTSRAEGPFEVIALGRRALDVCKFNDVDERIREIRPDVIFHAAAYTDIDACEAHKWRAYLVNRDGSKHVAQAAAKIGALMVYPSTDLIFDGARTLPYREEEPPNPLGVYADTKLAGELAVMSHAPRYLILRTGWLFGPCGRSYLNDLLGWRGLQDLVFGHEDQLRQPTYERDFVDAALELARRGETGVWNVVSCGQATDVDFAREFYAICGDRVDVRPVTHDLTGGTALRPQYSVLDDAKLESAGLKRRTWQAALRACLDEWPKR